MKKFEYKIDLHIEVWQRTALSVHAKTKEEADVLVIELAKETPLSLDNGNSNVSVEGTEYLCDTESLLESTTKRPTVEVYDENNETYEPQYALYTNIKRETDAPINEEI